MKKFLLLAMVAVGVGSVAACNRDTTPGSPNQANPGDRSAPPRAQNRSPSSAANGSSAQNTNPSASGASGASGAQSANSSAAGGSSAQNTNPGASGASGAQGTSSSAAGGSSAQNASPGSPGAQSTSPSGAAGSSNTSPRPGQGTETQVAQLSFESVDTNRDGVITQNEALAVQGLDFASADKDNSHTLSRQEFDAAMAKGRPGG